MDNSISSSDELKKSKYENPSNTATDSFFKAYEVLEIEKQSLTKRKYSNASNSINELPNKRMCKAEKERNEDNMSKIYQDIFQKKDDLSNLGERPGNSLPTGDLDTHTESQMRHKRALVYADTYLSRQPGLISRHSECCEEHGFIGHSIEEHTMGEEGENRHYK
ncbi:hypothetical protein Tco_1571346 [Tanacetum coccineum]